MKVKSTGELSNELMASADIQSYLKNNDKEFIQENLAVHLTELFRAKSISKADLARRSEMSEVYLHQIFSGRRIPTRDRVLCLCFGLSATLEETQMLLKHSGHAQLYPRIKRDSIILFGLKKQLTLREINDQLFAAHERALF